MAVADFEGLVVARGGGINSSLLIKKEHKSTVLGLDYYCCCSYGFTAYCNTIVYKQEFSTLIKKGCGGLSKLPRVLKDNGLNVGRILFCDRVDKQITGKINPHTSALRESD